MTARSFSGVESINLLHISGRISVHQTLESLFRGLQDWRSDAQTVFEYTSRSFQWIQVWTATWPLQKLYRVGLQPPGGSPAPMAWGSILQEDGATRDFNVCH